MGFVAAVVIFLVWCYVLVLVTGSRRRALEARVLLEEADARRRASAPLWHEEGSEQVRRPRFHLSSGHNTRSDEKSLRAVLAEAEPGEAESVERRVSR